MNDNTGTEANLLRHFPLALQWDERMQVMAQVIAKALALRWQEDRVGILYPDIDSLPERVLDILAYDFKVDWYDFNYPVSTKRKLIKENVLVHRRQGTVFATKTILNSLYPKSELEEWFTYGGEPGYFRLNVNVTDSAEDGAVVIYSTGEILRRIATVKRLSAHLEGVSYMVWRAIIIKSCIDSWPYCAPECGTIRCGTWWMRHTLGWSERHRLAVSGRAEPFEVSPELSGTLPEQSSKGYTLVCGAVRAGGVIDTFEGSPKEAGTPELTGTLPDETTKGYTIAGALTTGSAADGFKISPEYTGTLPEEAQHGERKD